MIGGNITLDGTLVVTELPGFSNGTYRLFNYAGTFTNNGLDLSATFLSAHPGSSIDVATPGQVNLIVIPEPSSIAALIAGLLPLALRRRTVAS
jgi:fibronectin-binding autotransporter adhesin